MPAEWTHEEVALTVADYLDMLLQELQGTRYNKREHNRRLQVRLDGRSGSAIEFKHQNISAVLLELGIPNIEGYKPLPNYQRLLKEHVEAQLNRRPEIETLTARMVDAPADDIPPLPDLQQLFVDPPLQEAPARVHERPLDASPTRRIDYLEREARNSSLGRAGELFVLEAESRRLWEAGQRHLAERIDHVAVTRGDGLGYDILSFEPDGRERYIEVKTTAFGPMTPFFASAREVSVSEQLPKFQLYRVFSFRKAARIFRLAGSLRQSCRLDATQFRATVA